MFFKILFKNSRFAVPHYYLVASLYGGLQQLILFIQFLCDTKQGKKFQNIFLVSQEIHLLL